MRIYKNRRFGVISLLFALCLLPLVSACVATIQNENPQLEAVAIVDEKGNMIDDFIATGSYTVVIAIKDEEEDIRLTCRYQDQELLSKEDWHKEQTSRSTTLTFAQEGDYQIIVEWLKHEEVVDQWESKIYHVVDMDNVLELQAVDHTSLHLQLADPSAYHAEVQLIDAVSGKQVDFGNEELIQGITFDQEGDWKLCLQIRDDEGNSLTKTWDSVLVIDRSNPTAAIRFHDQDVTQESLAPQSQPLTLQLSVADRHLDQASLSVFVNKKETPITWTQQDQTWQGSLTLVDDGSYVVQLYASDSMGNEVNITSTLISIDQKAPEIQLFLAQQPISELPQYLDHEAELECLVLDPHFDFKTSFITDVKQPMEGSWEQVDETKWRLRLILQEGKHDLLITAYDQLQHQSSRKVQTIVDSKQPIVKLQYEPLKAYQDSFLIRFSVQDKNIRWDDSMLHITCDGQKQAYHIDWNNEKDILQGTLLVDAQGLYQLRFDIQDQAGNKAVYVQNEQQSDHFEHAFLLDKTLPQLQVELSQPLMTNAAQTITVRVKDAHIDANKIQGILFQNDRRLSLPLVWHRQDDTLIAVYQVEEDGVYRLSLSASDLAGNHSAKTTEVFIIDKQAPQIVLQRTDQAFFQKQPFTMNIAVNDRYLQHAEINVYRDHQLYQTLQGKDAAAASLRFHQDGEYEITAVGIDESGNEATKHDTFILDQSAPQLTVTFDGIPAQSKQHYITNQDIQIKMQWEDRNLAQETIQLFKNDKPIALVYDKQQFSYHITAQKNHEDHYRLTVKLTDKAGNIREESYALSLDTFLPALRFVNDPFQGKPRNIAWKPQLAYENDAFHISEVTLYRNQQLVSNYRWGDVIEQDGRYMLSLSVRDEALNEATLLPPFSFTIDTTPPIIEIVEEERRELLLDEHVSVDTRLRLYLADELSDIVHVHTIAIGDVVLKESDSRPDENNRRYYPISFAKEGKTTVFIDVSDEAMNHTKKLITYDVSKRLTKEQVKTVEPKIPVAVSQNHNDYHRAWLIGAAASLLLILIVRKQYVKRK